MDEKPKHLQEQPITLTYPTGGMDTTTLPQLLPPQNAVVIDNFYYDFTSGYLRTRFPFRLYTTNGDPTTSPVTAITKWNNQLYFVAGNELYWLDSAKNSHDIGAIGTTPPCFLPFHGKLLIASGITPQELDTSNSLTTITGVTVPDTLTDMIELNQAVYATGNISMPDVLHQSATLDETTWSTGDANYYYLGYQEDPSVTIDTLNIVGISTGPAGYIIAFKRSADKKCIGYLDPNATAPVWIVVSDNESAISWRGQTYVSGQQWIMDDFSPMSIIGVDTSNKVEIDPNSLKIGARISNNWVLDKYAFCIVYPPHAQIWFIPNTDDGYIWVLHYLIGAWTRFRISGGVKFYSAYYEATTQMLYLGGNDGNIYTYADDLSGGYRDNPGGVDVDYTQTLRTAVYDPFPRNMCILKKPMVDYLAFTDGTAVWNFYQNYGVSPIESDFYNVPLTIDTSLPTLYQYSAETLFNHSNELLFANKMSGDMIPYNSPPVNTVQMELKVNSGAIAIQGFNVNLAQGRKKNQ